MSWPQKSPVATPSLTEMFLAANPLKKQFIPQTYKSMNVAVILAAGSGKRMKGRDKVLFKIKGRPLFYYTAKVFQEHPKIDKIIFVARKIYFKDILSAVKKYKLKK